MSAIADEIDALLGAAVLSHDESVAFEGAIRPFGDPLPQDANDERFLAGVEGGLLAAFRILDRSGDMYSERAARNLALAVSEGAAGPRLIAIASKMVPS